LFYNKDLIDHAPTTFQELEELSKDPKYAYENDKSKNVAFLAQWTNFYNAYGLIKGYGGYIFGDNGTDPKNIGLNNKGAVEGITYMTNWFK
ncbi:extracellular solute-binding protein, partial [Streptococcus danieliae]|nr:extracellular solute-binding protein [Streptococcus danieliae]